jgi:hypothetical protein
MTVRYKILKVNYSFLLKLLQIKIKSKIISGTVKTKYKPKHLVQNDTMVAKTKNRPTV